MAAAPIMYEGRVITVSELHSTLLKQFLPVVQSAVTSADFKLVNLFAYEPSRATAMLLTAVHRHNVFLINRATQCRLSKDVINSEELPVGVFALLLHTNIYLSLALMESTTPAAISKFLARCKTNECIVCYEDVETSAKHECSVCSCRLCHKCNLDKMRFDEKSLELYGQCPNCRGHMTAFICAEVMTMFVCAMDKPFDGLSTSQKRMIYAYTGYGGFAAMRKRVAIKGYVDEILPKMDFNRINQDSGRFFRKVAAVNAAEYCRDSCANCGKGFWNAADKRKAPKCKECKSIAYCNAKCRKAHRRMHALHCAAKVPKSSVGRKKPKRSKEKANCQPY